MSSCMLILKQRRFWSGSARNAAAKRVAPEASFCRDRRISCSFMYTRDREMGCSERLLAEPASAWIWTSRHICGIRTLMLQRLDLIRSMQSLSTGIWAPLSAITSSTSDPEVIGTCLTTSMLEPWNGQKSKTKILTCSSMSLSLLFLPKP